MSIEGNFQRGCQLFELNRFNEAIPFFKNVLSTDIDNFEAKYLLAQSYLHIDEIDNSKELALELRGEAPNFSDVYYLLSQINFHKGQNKEALENIDTAMSLDPYDENYFGHKAYILLDNKEFEEGLKFADEGLKLNAKSRLCLNARATILTKLKRKEEAKETIDNLLNDDPENAFSHANVGWSKLENNNIGDAQNHFREALKLDPNSDYAREGMLTTIKAKNSIYRLYLRYAFWIGNKSDRNQWIYLIGIYLVYRFSVKILSYSGLTILSIPLIIAYLLFALGTWIMDPLSNMILLFDKNGKFLLNKNSKMSGQILFSLLSIALVSYVISFIVDADILLLISIGCLAAILPLTRSPLLINKPSKVFGYSYGILILLIALTGTAFGFSFGSVTLTLAIMFVAYTWLGSLIFN